MKRNVRASTAKPAGSGKKGKCGRNDGLIDALSLFSTQLYMALMEFRDLLEKLKK